MYALISHCTTAADAFRSASMVGSAILTTDSSTYEIVDAMMVTASTQGLLLPAQSIVLTDRIAVSSQGRGFGFGMQSYMCLAAVKTNTSHSRESRIPGKNWVPLSRARS